MSETVLAELPEEKKQSGFSRRSFLKAFGKGLVVVIVAKDLFSREALAANSSSAAIPENQVGAWIHILEDGTVKVFTGKVEVGQNIRTSLSQAVAEELHVPLSSVTMIMGDTGLVPFDAGTFGSRSTPQMGPQLRRAAATARLALIDMAAKNWNADPKSLQASQGMVINPGTNKKIGYGELTKGQQLLLPLSNDVQLAPANEWKVLGKTALKINGNSFVTGKHQFVSDMKVPDMLYGKVLRPPTYLSKLISADIGNAQAIPGVTVVRDGDFIGLVATNPRIAEKAIQMIQAQWDTIGTQPSRTEIFDHLVKNSNSGRGAANDLEQALASAETRLKNTFHVNYIAHVPLEPRAALARWDDGKLTVWTGTQRPFGVRTDLSRTFNVAEDNVRVIMPDTGSAYGGKHSGEAALEAARLARAVKKPVKLVWTRQEEFMWAYFRPAGVIEVDSGIGKDGNIVAWKFHNYNSGPAAVNTQYAISNQENTYIPSKTPFKQGSYRGLASTANVFARESHIGDIIRLLKKDQLEFRLKNLNDERLKAVLQAAAKAFGWNNNIQSQGRGYGIACGFDKGDYVATCAEIAINDKKEIKVIRLTEAFECGAIVNPGQLENQVMGAMIMGLGGALFEAIDFAGGKILNDRLSLYRVPRFEDVPKIDIVMLNRDDLPSAGAGEAAIIGVAPAIRNAILDATGIGLTTLPLLPGSGFSI